MAVARVCILGAHRKKNELQGRELSASSGTSMCTKFASVCVASVVGEFQRKGPYNCIILTVGNDQTVMLIHC